MPNLLKNEKSPYLLQHMDNPVNWYPWGEEAFEKARQEDKPVFLSIGYSTCHWCHVMAHESFEDDEVATVLNRDFISIKVDREERPDIDSVYMSVCISMMGSGGWPLTVFLTPDKKPFFAATYLPKHGNAFQYGLIDLLNSVSYMWSSEREKILNSAVQELRSAQVSGTVKPHYALAHRAFEKFCGRFDSKWGGFGRAPKFPTPNNLLFLMRYGQAENESPVEIRTLLVWTLAGVFLFIRIFKPFISDCFFLSKLDMKIKKYEKLSRKDKNFGIRTLMSNSDLL